MQHNSTITDKLKYKIKSDNMYWSDILLDDTGRSSRDDKIASICVRTLSKNLIRPHPMQDLEGDEFRRPALPVADARRRSGWRELWWQRSCEQRQKSDLYSDGFGAQKPYIELCLRTDKNPWSDRRVIHKPIDSCSDSGSDPYRDRIEL
jgi:hypothetical protein